MDQRDRIAEKSAALAATAQAIETARKWRGELIEAMRDTLSMRGPIRVGSRGYIGKARCEGIRDKLAMIRYRAVVAEVGRESETEGVGKINVLVRPTRIALVGVDTSKMTPEADVVIDRSFEVFDTFIDREAVEIIYLARPKPDDAEELMRECLKLKVPE